MADALPDVFVKGGDYTRDRLPEPALVEELGGEVRILPLTPDRSTTGLIARVRASGGRDGRGQETTFQTSNGASR